ncbi:MAG: Y-family DNA polymerase, partial [Bacteroidota bacterium]
MFALVDCNSFYASCERVFRPDLNGKPVGVLSNNDGCLIALSPEMKALGFKMGSPWFQINKAAQQAGTVVFSSNYELYADMSHRVVECLRQFSPTIEIYSIDEVFIDLRGLRECDPLDLGHKMRRTVKKWTGIPVGVGIAPTKTLAKVANRQAKQCEGVCVIEDPIYHNTILAQFPVSDLWGVGRQYTKKLAKHGIHTAAELCARPDDWIRKEMTVQGLRLVYELRGVSCIPLEELPEPQKALAVTRSFGTKITSWEPIKEAMVHYATRAGEKLRAKGLKSRHCQVFLHTSRHSQPFYSRANSATLPIATDYTPELAKYAVRLLKPLYRPGYRFAKCGIILTDLCPAETVQTDLFTSTDELDKQAALMKAMDNLNRRYGKHTVALAGAGVQKKWFMQRKQLSPCYTTRMSDLLKL